MQAQKLDCNSKNDRDMIVEVIKGVEHSIELNFGESSVCITPDEAQKLIGQLRAVLPAPSDVEEAARGYATAHIKRAEWVPMDVAFLDGAKWKEGQLMKDAVEGIAVDDHLIKVCCGDGEEDRYIDLDPLLRNHAVFRIKESEKVSVIIIKKEK